MTEAIENAFQIFIAGGCLIYALFKAMSLRSRSWILLMFFYAELFMGNLYWQLYLIFINGNPLIPFVSEFCWDVALGFLLVLVNRYSKGKISIKHDPVLLVIPVFTVGMAIFYMQWGQIADNIAVAVLMTFLILRCVYGLRMISGRGYYASAREKDPKGSDPAVRGLYCVMLWFCTIEYLSWTASCFFDGDTLANPYYWCDIALSISLLFFIPALNRCNIKKNVARQGEGLS